MATNIKFAFPQIPFNATNHAFPGKSYSGASYDAEDVVAGSRSNRFQFDTTASIPQHHWDLGSNYQSITGNTADYCIIADASLLLADGSAAVRLACRTATSGLYTSIFNNAWTVSDLKGPNLRDYITTFTETSVYRQWNLSLHSATGTQKFPHSKVYIGKLFDFGRDPTIESSWEVGYHQDKGIHEAIALTFKWEGITEAKREEFESKIGQYKDEHPVFVYASSYDEPTLGTDLLNCVIEDYEFSARNGYRFDLNIKLREVF